MCFTYKSLELIIRKNDLIEMLFSKSLFGTDF